MGCALREVRLQYGRHGRVCHAVFHAMYDRWHCDHHEDQKKWSADEGGSILVKEFLLEGVENPQYICGLTLHALDTVTLISSAHFHRALATEVCVPDGHLRKSTLSWDADRVRTFLTSPSSRDDAVAVACTDTGSTRELALVASLLCVVCSDALGLTNIAPTKRRAAHVPRTPPLGCQLHRQYRQHRRRRQG